MRSSLSAALAALLLLAPAAEAKIVQFQTPSGNVHCVFAKLEGTPRTLRCDIRETDNAPEPKPASCELDYGYAYGMQRRGRASRLCHGDTAVDTSARVLAYGKRFKRGGFVCRSRKAGLRCRNRADHGWFLSRSRQTLF